MSIGCETAAIDRWVEPANEPAYICRKCGHLAEYHDERGCFSDMDDFQGNVWCDCEGFE